MVGSSSWGPLWHWGAIFYVAVCWGSSILIADRKRLDKLIEKATSILGCHLDLVEVVGGRRMMAKLSSLINNDSHPMWDTLRAPSTSDSLTQSVWRRVSLFLLPTLLLQYCKYRHCGANDKISYLIISYITLAYLHANLWKMMIQGRILSLINEQPVYSIDITLANDSFQITYSILYHSRW